MESSYSSMLTWMKAYRPLFFESLSGITAIHGHTILACDYSRGLLTEINLATETEGFKPNYNVQDYAEIDGICYFDGRLYSVYQNNIYVAPYGLSEPELNPKLFLSIPNCSNLTGIAVTAETIYLATENRSILSCDQQTKAVETVAKSPGTGVDDLCVFQGNLFIADAVEQTIYVLNLETQQVIEEILTPFENPTGLTFIQDDQIVGGRLYIAYSRPSFEIYDTGDSEFKLKIETPVADNFIYPLIFKRSPKKTAVLSNPFWIEMYYVEKLHALPEVSDRHPVVRNLDWKISLPMDTDRQQLISLEKIGDFDMKIETISEEENRQVAVFSIPEINLETDRKVFGWKATIKTASIRYFASPDQIPEISEDELQRYAQYLKDEPGLDMNHPSVIRAAEEAVQSLADADKHNPLAKVKAIRDYVYATLTYVMDAYHDGTETVLRQGEGSCGEYLKVFLSLLRLNQIPARECGNYKVPAYKMQAGAKSMVLSPDFNHVWLQFYLPNLGWVPLESSADDGSAAFRDWAQRYFMALAWYHVECRLGSYFEEVFEAGTDTRFFLAPGDLAIKDIKFRVLGEIGLD
ncbi:MAG: transglutaminase domain-containing protein [Microcoleaceae cyanobacterium]